ncbi:MAG TPA: DHA2 family efflux MFS transporter permease subunit [Chloroflexi bacterium]|jgi:EmrB/QacA subfamily drug resistance transporter|nr:DHA2 family efflux MFS transporter permease subunit [Chloroflexota bacterium]
MASEARETAAQPDGSPPYASVVLAATILGSSLAFIDSSVVGVALPVMQVDLQATLAAAQWVVEANQLLLAALILVGGALGDVFGRRRLFALGIATFLVGTVAAGLAPNIGFLIAARSLQGIGGALLVPGSLAIITATFFGGARGRAIGLWAALTTVASALGPIIGGWLVEQVSWRAVFFLNIPLGLVALALTLWRVPETMHEGADRSIDVLGAALQVIGLGGLVFGLIEAGASGFGEPLVIAALIIGVVALALFIVRQARIRSPMMPLTLFRSSDFSGTNLLTFLLYGGLYGVLFFLPFNLIQVQGYTATAAGAAQLPFIVLLSVLSPWAGGLVARYGPRPPLVLGPLTAALGFALYALPGQGGSYWTTFFPPTAVLGLGMAITVAPLTTTVMSAAPSERSGTASGINNAVSRIAGLLAVAILGVVAVSAYSGALSSALANSPLPAEYGEILLAQRTRLAATEIPADAPAQVQDAMRAIIAQAYISAFRLIAIICAALGAAAAAVTAIMIGGRRHT